MLTCTEVTYLILTHSLLSCIVGELNGNTEGKTQFSLAVDLQITMQAEAVLRASPLSPFQLHPVAPLIPRHGVTAPGL